MTEEKSRARTTGSASRWLDEVGLGRYAELFAQNRIDLDILQDLTEADLAELALPLGDRKRLLRAIASSAEAPNVSGGSAAGRRPSLARPKTAAAERRQLTVMFCDMVGSTALSAQFDPEDLRDVIAAYRETCARIVVRYDGFIARYVGDGIMVYFGYPMAHEDDAERAVLTGLEIVRAVSKQSRESPGRPAAPAAVRIGIATGLVVVGDVTGDSTEEYDSAVGETPNLAARLQALAPENGVVIAPSTRSLLSGRFEYADLGSQSLKGISAPVRAWLVVRPRRSESRFAATVDSGLTPMIDREEEIALLLKRWQQAKAVEGQVVLLSGEPGIGKSRIIQEFRQQTSGESYQYMAFQCTPYSISTPLYPFIRQLNLLVDNTSDTRPQLSLQQLRASLAPRTGQVAPMTPSLAASLVPANELSPQRQKDETVAALVDHLLGLAREKPAVMIFEDAHWIDPTSREVLDSLVDRIQNASVLLVITYRPEFQASWNAHSHITALTLNRLSRQLRVAMVRSVAGANPLPTEVVEEISAKTDGVPLFIEELTKAILESNLLTKKDGRYVLSGPLGNVAIPATLTDSLMARLDRMGSFKDVAQTGATIGREFSFELLRAVADAPEDQLVVALNRLEKAGLLIRRGHPPEAIYSFKHALVQDAAHSSLLNRDRKRLHAKIATALRDMYPERVEREPELLAHHFTEAGQSNTAVDYWLKAGELAARTRANLEAIAHLRRGLEVLEASPEIQGRDRRELVLRIALGNPLIAAKGYAVQEVEENYSRALELAQRLDDKSKIFGATRGLWVCYFIRADLDKASDLGMQLLKLAEGTQLTETVDHRHQKTGYLIESHRALGMTMLYSGCFGASRDHFELGIRLYEPNHHGSLVESHGIDPGIVCLSYLGYVLWFLGCPDRARAVSDQALTQAKEMQHPFTLAFASAFRAYLCQHLRDAEGTLEYADRTMEISADHGFLHWKQQATILRGWALAELGQIDDGLTLIRGGLAGYEALDSGLGSTWFRSLLANAQVKAGRPDAALRALDDAHTFAERTGERFFLAEIFRLQGEVALMQRNPKASSEAEACFDRSLGIARSQGALCWELRTALSLARLWRGMGRCQDAAELIAPVCRRFTQGHDTPDVQEAIQVLSELQGR